MATFWSGVDERTNGDVVIGTAVKSSANVPSARVGTLKGMIIITGYSDGGSGSSAGHKVVTANIAGASNSRSRSTEIVFITIRNTIRGLIVVANRGN